MAAGLPDPGQDAGRAPLATSLGPVPAENAGAGRLGTPPCSIAEKGLGASELERPDREGPDPLSPAEVGERWVVLYTHPNCEKLLARACTSLGVRHYLPLVDRWSGPPPARRRAGVPLFPSYLFACPGYADLILTLQIARVVRVIRVEHPETLIHELRQIRQALAATADLTLGSGLACGERVRVIHGALMGVEGIIQGLRRRKRRHRLMLNVSILGRAVATEVDVKDVERVRDPFATVGSLDLDMEVTDAGHAAALFGGAAPFTGAMAAAGCIST